MMTLSLLVLFLVAAHVSAGLRASSVCTVRTTSEGGFPSLTTADQYSSGLKVPGSLVIAGGSLAKNSTVFRRFLELAGGELDAKIVRVPLANRSARARVQSCTIF